MPLWHVDVWHSNSGLIHFAFMITTATTLHLGSSASAPPRALKNSECEKRVLAAFIPSHSWNNIAVVFIQIFCLALNHLCPLDSCSLQVPSFIVADCYAIFGNHKLSKSCSSTYSKHCFHTFELCGRKTRLCTVNVADLCHLEGVVKGTRLYKNYFLSCICRELLKIRNLKRNTFWQIGNTLRPVNCYVPQSSLSLVCV